MFRANFPPSLPITASKDGVWGFHLGCSLFHDDTLAAHAPLRCRRTFGRISEATLERAESAKMFVQE
eukprot:14744713-Heterocapsa_arctica.AAC.1